MLTVGKILKSQREKKNLKLEDIEKDMRVRTKFLNALENDDWTLFSSKIYIGGLIKNYSKYLNLDHNKILAFFRRQYEKKEEVSFKKNLSAKYLTPQTRKILYFFLFTIISAFVYYFGYQVHRYVTPPKVEILTPKILEFKNQDRVKIIGKTEKEAVVKIFGERIYQNEKGEFSYDFPLKLGKNKLEVEVIGANGKKTTISKIYILND
ncbi:MAG: helix-turn-helix domain-containing protein [bacterium]|nr:helix-turn-helix domain-containing protein [bacterium]